MAVSSKVVTAGFAALVAVGAVGIIIQQNQLQASNSHLAASNEHLREEVAAASMRELPMLMGFRSALLGHGKVVRIENVSGEDMAVQAHVVDAASHQTRDFTWNIDRGRSAEFGHVEGYTFEPGDQVTLSHDGYKAKTWTVP